MNPDTASEESKTGKRPIVGVVPAAGQAKRWRGEIDYSKELYPVRWPGRPGTEIPVIAQLLDAFRVAGIQRSMVVTRPNKLDIPARLLDGKDLGCVLAYIVVESSPGVPYSIAAAKPFLEGCDVVLGFPDIVFEPHDAVRTMVEGWRSTNCDVLLGLFESDDPASSDMVELGPDGRIQRIVVKQPSSLRYSWLMAVWGPRFTAFLADFVAAESPGAEELHTGHILQRAIDAGFTVIGVPVHGGRYLDTGSPERAARIDEFWQSA
jgi:glucose-1-phosphate thymidylyltransferase